MRIRGLIVAVTIGVLGLFPAMPAQATHSCGFDPCPHPEDVFTVIDFLCEKYPILTKYVDVCNIWP